ncbi:MAG: CBS domain-containing protein, partial [Candidatus Heimdallarchaeota archaeon]|nr:CBS domain-containing protein [Candidatus Heimdallarchaeota archaeon]
ITIDESESLNEAIHKMEESRTHHLIVTIDRGNVIGILSSFDIVRERSKEIKSLV